MSPTVRINGEPQILAPGATVADAVATLSGSGRGTAVAHNGAVVPRSQWDSTGLSTGDAVEVLTASQGG